MGGTSRKIWLFAGLLVAAAAGGFIAWRALRAAYPAAAGTKQEQVSQDMDRAAAGFRHAADDLRSQVSQLTVQLRDAASGKTADVKSQGSHLAAGMKPRTRRARTPGGNAVVDPKLTVDDQG
ncbi:hypothetical protein [Arthrobacter crystallopoietes]|uniref:hypothetical protein n=1 Tax=Crystallibacter crystallopoietes TaxID=37928 RepID=UPI001486DD26|nr:hypothetical protein [Arthrobacter crystallopoietes]